MQRDKSIIVVLAATFYLIGYLILLSSNETLRIAFFMFSLSPFLIVWMVLKVLKQENKSSKSFDEYFYEDVDEKRSGGTSSPPSA